MKWYDALLPYVGNNSLVPGYDYLKQELGGAKNSLEGNPAGASQALSGLMSQAYAQGGHIKDFLESKKGGSEAYYKPMQQMFGLMYGTNGLMPPKAPAAPGGGAAY